MADITTDLHGYTRSSVPLQQAIDWACWPCARMLGWIAYAALWG